MDRQRESLIDRVGVRRCRALTAAVALGLAPAAVWPTGVRAAMPSPDDAAGSVAAPDQNAVMSVDPARIAALLRAATDGDNGSEGFLRAGRAATAMVERAPSSVLATAEALRELGKWHGYRPGQAASALEEAGGMAAWLAALVGAGESFERDRAAFMETIERIDAGGLAEDELAAAWIARARLLAAMERDADALQATRAIPHEHDGRRDPWALDARLRLLGVLGHDAELLALAMGSLPAERPEPGDATAAELLSSAGEAALRLNDRALALTLLTAARDIQPGSLARHERVVALLLEEPGAVESISLRSPLGRAMRALRQHHPDAALLELVLVGEAVRRDQPALVVRTLEQLAERYPRDERIRGQLVARWLDVAETDKALALIEGRLESAPSAAHAADLVLYGRILAAQGLPDRAIQRLGTWIDEQGDDPRVLAELERLYRGGLFSASDAERMRVRRLQALPKTIAHEIERAGAETIVRERAAAAEALRSAFERAVEVRIETPARSWLGELPDRVPVSLTAEQRAVAIETIRAIAARGPSAVPAADVVAMFEAGAEVLAPIPEDLASHWVAMVLVSGAGLEPAIDAAERVSAGSKELRRAVFRGMLQELGVAGQLNNAFVAALREDPRSALTVAERGAMGGGGDDPELFSFWLLAGYMAAAGDPRDERYPEIRRSVAEATRRAHDAGLLREAVASATSSFRSMPAADLCARLARIADPDQHWDAAVLLYRQALEFDPSHPGVNNSYGYRLVEREEQLDLAETMIERAVRGEPNEPAYLDSLGWARYKRGMLLDEPPAGPLGGGREGAITLLERSLELLGSLDELEAEDPETMVVLFNKPTILDHAGDAHWAAGNADLAKKRWAAAAERAAQAGEWIERRGVAELVDAGWILREIDRIKASTAEKLEAAEAGREVPIARILGPRPDPPAPEEGPGG